MTDQDSAVPIEHLRALVANLHAEINRSDTKCSVMLAAFAVVVAPIGSVLASDRNVVWESPWPLVALTWTAIALTFAALLSFSLSLLPRIRRHGPPDQTRLVGYFGDILKNEKAQDVGARLPRTQAEAQQVWLEQLVELARIVRTKYAWARWATFLMMVAVPRLITSVTLIRA